MEGGQVLAEVIHNTDITHSRRLLALIDNVMKDTQTTWDMLGGICVGLGPGSFTGLRIGLATAKGLAFGSDIQFYGISTLDGFAKSSDTDKLVCSIIDARKKEVYGAFYRRSVDGDIYRESEFFVMPPEQLAAKIDEPVHMVGEGVSKYRELFTEMLGEGVSFGGVYGNTVSAAVLGLLVTPENLLDASSATPIYVRASDAELNLIRKNS